MPVFTVVSPYLVSLNASDLTSAVKQFAKTYYHMKINEIIIKDHIRHHRATLNYLKENGHNRVGIRVFPHMYPVVASTIPISQAVIIPGKPNQLHKDGSIKEYNHSPTMVVTSDKTLALSPYSPIAPMFGFPGLSWLPNLFGSSKSP